MARVYFSEEQKFTDSPFIYVFVFSAIALLGGLVYAALDANNISEWEEFILAMVLSTVLLFGIGWLLFTIRLESHVENGRITYRMPPLINQVKVIAKEEISHAEIIRYNPITRYGGYGIRHSLKHGKALNIRGNQGLQIQLKNGKKLLLGTQKPELLKQAVAKMMENKEDYG